MATIIRGGVGHDPASHAGQQYTYDVSEEILTIAPNKNKLYVLTEKLGTEEVEAPDFKWYDTEMFPWTCQVNGAINASATSLVLDDSTMLRPNDILINPKTSERILVEVVDNTTNTVTIKRNLGSSGASAIDDNSLLFILANCSEEFGMPREALSVLETERNNFTQIFTTELAITNTELASKQIGKPTLAKLREEKIVEHRSKYERAMMFGKYGQITTGTKYKRFMGGLIEFITNTYSFGAVPTEDDFEDFCEAAFEYGSDEKFMICSAPWLTELNRWGRHKLQISPKAKELGLNITRFISAHGAIDLVPSAVLKGSYFGNYGFVLDPQFIKKVNLKGRANQYLTNQQLPGADGRLDFYRSESSIMVKNAPAHYVVTFGI